MARAPFEADWWVGARSLTSFNNTMVLDHEGEIQTISLPTGWYWHYDDRGNTPVIASAYPSLFKMLRETVSNALFGDTVSVTTEACTPGLSVMPNSGLSIKLSDQSALTFMITHPSWTFPVDALGLSTLTPDYPQDVSVPDGTDYVSPYAIGGNWTTTGRASFKMADEFHEQYASGRRNEYRWGTDVLRTMSYMRLPAGIVRHTRAAEDIAWASRARAAMYDGNNTFQQLWRYALSRRKPALVVHNRASDHTLELPTAGVEALALEQEEQRARFSACVGKLPEERRGEFYKIELDTEVLYSTYIHS